MNLLVLDSKYDAIAVVDEFKSSIWTVRFHEAGDFELYLPATKKNIDTLKEDLYLWRNDSDRLMIIETVNIESDVEQGAMLTVSGRSLESILDRRVVATYIDSTDSSINNNVQELIYQMLVQNAISPSISARKIPGLTFKRSTDKAITSLKVEDTYFYGETLYDAVVSLCKLKKIGFRVLPSGEGGFEFELFAGLDRSYDQEDRPWVVFSPKFENLLSSNYIKSFEAYKNAIFSIGTYQKEYTESDSEGNVTTTYEETAVTAWADIGRAEPSGLSRREMFLDNTDVTGGEKGGEASKWESVVKSKGKETLANYDTVVAFDGQLDAVRQYVYKEDFDLGDIVQVINEFDMTAKSYISELVFSLDDTGEQLIPTFTSTEEELY